ncbi:MAG: PEP/pyruvate-binding domain-containing protein [Sciscionella sp.]
MEVLIPLTSAADRVSYGGKTARLAEAKQAGFSVPDGYAIPAQSVATLRAGDQALSTALREDLLHLVQQKNMRGPFAVRSSGQVEDGDNASFAGIYRTVLNVAPKIDDLVTAIEECVTAADADRLREYARASGIHEIDVIAILIQQMVPAEIAGVAFSEAYGTRGEYVLVEAVEGLGESLVSGATTPSRYLLSLPLATDASKQHLSVSGNNRLGHHAYEVAQLALQAAGKFGATQDIEWAIADDKLWLLQSRPITAPVTVQDEPVATDTNALLTGFGASPGHVTANVRILRESDDPFEPGAILVAANTDTDFLPAMHQASGFVTEEGGLLSHAALVARELDLPCIVGAAQATTTLSDGQLVTIDGGTGLVYAGNTEPTGTTSPVTYDFTGLYCFDTVHELIVDSVSIIVEPSADGYAVWLPPSEDESRQQELAPTLRKQLAAPVRFPVSDKYPIYIAYARRMRESTAFRTAFGKLLATTWTLDAHELHQILQMLLAHSQACLTATERESDPLVAYLLLDTVGGNYLLGNTIFPEGYGIRAVYQAISPRASRAGTGVSNYLVDAHYADDPAVRYYTLLAETRASSYPAYVAFGGTDDPYYERLNAARERLATNLGVKGQDRETVQTAIAAAAQAQPNAWKQVNTLLQPK